jgi:hypothetical protein
MRDAARRFACLHAAAAGAVGTGIRAAPAPYPPGAAAPRSTKQAAAAAAVAAAASSMQLRRGFNVIDNPLGSGGAERVDAGGTGSASGAAPALVAAHLPTAPSEAVSVYYERHPSCIWPGLYLGSSRLLDDVAALRRLRITHVVVCTGGGAAMGDEAGEAASLSWAVEPTGALGTLVQRIRVGETTDLAAGFHRRSREGVATGSQWGFGDSGEDAGASEGPRAWEAWIVPFVQYVWSAHGQAEGARVLVAAAPSPRSTAAAAAATLCMAFLLAELRCSPFEALERLRSRWLGVGPTVPQMTALCAWADAVAAERRRLTGNGGGGRLTCACGRWAAALLRPLDAVRDRNPRRCACTPAQPGNACPCAGGCAAALEALAVRHGYRGESMRWALTDEAAVALDPLCAAAAPPRPLASSPTAVAIAAQRGSHAWQLFQCSACHCLTHAVKERAPPPRPVAVLANWMELHRPDSRS